MTKPQIIKYLKTAELNIQSAYAAFFPLDLVFTAYADSDKIHGINFGPICCYLSFKKLSTFFQIINQENIDKVSDKIYQNYLKSPKSLKQKIKTHITLTKELENIWQDYQKRKDKLTKKEILRIYKNLVHTAQKWWQYGAIGEDKGQIIERKIIPNFQKRYNWSAKKAREIVSILSHPDEQTGFNRERKLFLEICLFIIGNKKLKTYLQKKNYNKILESQSLKKKIFTYIKNYFWIKTDYYCAPDIAPKSLLKDVAQEIKKNTKEMILKEIKKAQENFRKIQSQKGEVLAKVKLSPEDKKDIKFAQQIIYWIEIRKIGMMKLFYFLFSFLGNLAKYFHTPYYDLSLYTVKELEEFIKTGKQISEDEKRQREGSFFVIFEKVKKAQMFYGKEAQDMFKIAIKTHKKDLKGIVSCTGDKKIIKGRVKIVKNLSQDEFYPDEILVTSMTRNELVPLMRKAKAVITDEGGLACHAAIISRELGVPCVIGTKIAMQILKDGDRVEVDVNQGIIKIIK